MPKLLNAMWTDINERFFNNDLKPLSLIDWDRLRGEEGIGAHGFYEKIGRGIFIDDEFKFDAELARAGDEKERAKMEGAYRILMHEMIHQALHERGDANFGKHRQSFLDEAVRIAAIMEVDPPTSAEVAQWPRLETALFTIRGLGEGCPP